MMVAFLFLYFKETQMKTKDVKVGVPFYTVLALGEGSFMIKFTPTSKPYEKQIVTGYVSTFVSGIEEIMGERFEKEASLSDAGIIPNTYNHHESFLSEKVAKHHLKLVKKFSS
jgi:hypothetical protein